MDFYQVLEKRRTIRDFSGREVTDEVLEKILSAAFKAPTNDHLRQFEFVVVRGPENIARLVSPVAENTEAIQQTGLKAAAETMDKDEHAMFVDALPKQQRMLMQSNCTSCRSSGKRTVRCAVPPTKVRSTISHRPGPLWKTSCWQRRRRGWHVLSEFPSVTSPSM